MSNLNDPNLNLSYGWPYGFDGWNTGMDTNLKQIGGLLFLDVVTRVETTPPAIINGNRYLIPSGATDAWAGKTNQIAVAIEDSWEYYTPKNGWNLVVADEDNLALSYKTASGQWETTTVDLSGYITDSDSPTWTGSHTFNNPITQGAAAANPTELMRKGEVEGAIESIPYTNVGSGADVYKETDVSTGEVRLKTLIVTGEGSLTENADDITININTQTGGGGGNFDPAADETITGKWGFTQPVSIDTGGSSTDVGGTLTTPIGILDNYIGDESGAVIPTPLVLNPEIIGGLLIGAPIDVPSMASSTRYNNLLYLGDEINGYKSIIDSRMEKDSNDDISIWTYLDSTSPVNNKSSRVFSRVDESSDSAYASLQASYSGSTVELEATVDSTGERVACNIQTADMIGGTPDLHIATRKFVEDTSGVWEYKSASFTAEIGKKYLVDGSSSLIITLPAQELTTSDQPIEIQNVKYGTSNPILQVANATTDRIRSRVGASSQSYITSYQLNQDERVTIGMDTFPTGFTNVFSVLSMDNPRVIGNQATNILLDQASNEIKTSTQTAVMNGGSPSDLAIATKKFVEHTKISEITGDWTPIEEDSSSLYNITSGASNTCSINMSLFDVGFQFSVTSTLTNPNIIFNVTNGAIVNSQGHVTLDNQYGVISLVKISATELLLIGDTA